MFIKYIFHKIQKCAPQLGFNDEKFDNLNNMGIQWTRLKTGVQNNLQNWKILKIGQVNPVNWFEFWNLIRFQWYPTNSISISKFSFDFY